MVHRELAVRRLGRTNYADAHALQLELQGRRCDGLAQDTLLLTEHAPVFTLGRSHPDADLRVPAAVITKLGIPIVQTERGGDITYHGPGQLVAYGIIDLRAWDLRVLDYVTGLEESVIRTIAEWGVRGERKASARGVWVEGRKMASLGIHVRRWVSLHGIALNVAPDMSHFELINPCGMADVEMTSLAGETGMPIAMADVDAAFERHFCEVFGATVLSRQAHKQMPVGG